MILEAAFLLVLPGKEKEFEQDFKLASEYIVLTEGYIKHSLKRCIEQENKYLLLVEWDSLEAHTIGFRKSEQYQHWKKLLHHYYNPFPIVEHFTTVINSFEIK